MTLANVYSAPGDGTSAENFRAILEQLPRSPGSLKRIRAWQSYDEALKIAGGKTDSSAKHSVTESNGKPKFSSILSALCNEEVQHSNSLKKETRKASTVHGLTIEEHEHSPHQSVDHAHNVSIKSEPNSASSMSILPDKAKNRIHAVLSRYAGAADRPELSNMIQQKRAEEIKAGQELNDITTLAWRRKHKKWDRYKQYREGTLGKKHSSRQANRVNRKGSQKRSQPVQVNEKRTSQKKQKNALDGLFAEAGY